MFLSRVGREALVAGVAVPVLFVVWQYGAARSFAERVDDPTALAFQIAFFIVPYLSVTMTGVIAALAGRPLLAVLPPLAYAGFGWAASSTVSDGVLGSWPVGAPSARLLGLAAALVPCTAAALLARRSRSAWGVGISGAAGLALVGGVVGLAIVTRGVVSGLGWDTNVDLIAVAVIAGLAGGHRPVLIPAALMVATSLSPEMLSWVAAGVTGTPPIGDVSFFCVIALAAAARRPLVALIDRLRRRPIGLFAAVNVLNAADALTTFVAVRGGAAAEANPVVEIIGLPAKVAVGLLASLVIRRHRPDLLLIPIVALAIVLAWHVMGVLII